MTHADLFARKNAKTGALTEEFFHGFDAGGDVFSPGNPYLNTSPAHMAFEAGRRAAFDFQRGDIVGAAASRGYSIRVKMKNGASIIYAVDYDRKHVTPRAARSGANLRRNSKAKKNPSRKHALAFVIRGTQATKSGYIHYYLHGDRFMSAIKGADVFSRQKGEARMREIAPTLPAAIREITLVRKGRS